MAMSRPQARPRPTLLVLVLMSLTLMTIDNMGGGTVGDLRGGAQDVLSPAQSAASDLASPVTSFVHGVLDYSRVRDDNARLRAQVTDLQGRQVKDRYLEQENKDLHAQLGLDFLGDIKTVTAQVVGGATSSFQLTITIDRGMSAGVVRGMPVVSSTGLVGRVSRVSAHQATVLVVTDASAHVGVQLTPSAALGVASGQGSGRGLDVTLVGPSNDVPVGAAAVTSGLAGSPYPRGVPVGRVTASEPRPGPKARVVTLRPVVDLNHLSYVDVLIWAPQTVVPVGGNVTAPTSASSAVPGR